MSTKAQNDLNRIKSEFNSVVGDLEIIRDYIHRNFIGIGNNTCFTKLGDVLSSHYKAKSALRSVDTTNVAQWNSEP